MVNAAGRRTDDLAAARVVPRAAFILLADCLWIAANIGEASFAETVDVAGAWIACACRALDRLATIWFDIGPALVDWARAVDAIVIFRTYRTV